MQHTPDASRAQACHFLVLCSGVAPATELSASLPPLTFRRCSSCAGLRQAHCLPRTVLSFPQQSAPSPTATTRSSPSTCRRSGVASTSPTARCRPRICALRRPAAVRCAALLLRAAQPCCAPQATASRSSAACFALPRRLAPLRPHGRLSVRICCWRRLCRCAGALSFVEVRVEKWGGAVVLESGQALQLLAHERHLLRRADAEPLIRQVSSATFSRARLARAGLRRRARVGAPLRAASDVHHSLGCSRTDARPLSVPLIGCLCRAQGLVVHCQP